MVTGSRPCVHALACLLLLTSAAAAQTRVNGRPVAVRVSQKVLFKASN